MLELFSYWREGEANLDMMGIGVAVSAECILAGHAFAFSYFTKLAHENPNKT